MVLLVCGVSRIQISGSSYLICKKKFGLDLREAHIITVLCNLGPYSTQVKIKVRNLEVRQSRTMELKPSCQIRKVELIAHVLSFTLRIIRITQFLNTYTMEVSNMSYFIKISAPKCFIKQSFWSFIFFRALERFCSPKFARIQNIQQSIFYLLYCSQRGI